MNFNTIKKYITRTSFIKTLVLSIRFRRRILVGRYCKVQLGKKARIVVKKGGLLSLGVLFSMPQNLIVVLEDNSSLIVDGKAEIASGGKVYVGAGAVLSIGSNSYINEHTRIQCRKSISIGADCAIAFNVTIMDTDEHHICYEETGKISVSQKPVTIGNHVWVGASSIILKGSSIRANTIVAAGSVVNKEFYNEKVIIAGNPAAIIKSNVSWN